MGYCKGVVMRKRSILLVVFALVVAVSLPSVALAVEPANAECLTCHAVGGAALSEVDFSGGTVNYSKCMSCHWPNQSSFVAAGFAHSHIVNRGPDCGSCHTPWGSTGWLADTSKLMQVTTPLGSYAMTGSPSTGSLSIHEIHANGSWPANVVYADKPVVCQSCHLPPSCTGCHDAPVTDHTDHTMDASTGAYAYAPVTRWVGLGTPINSNTIVRVREESSTCVNDACHSLAKAATAQFVPTCASCHPTKAGAHGYEPTQHTSTWAMEGCIAAGCHTSRELMPEHQAANPAFTCSTCHSSADPNVVAAIAANSTACGSCHTGITEAQGHYAQHYANPSLAMDGTGNYGYYDGTAATVKTAECAGCHTENLMDEHLGTKRLDGTYDRFPRYTRTAEALTCETCHSPLAAAEVANAVAGSQTRCDACHTVHGPMNEQHASTYVDSPAIPCAECHSALLQDEHAAVSVTTASGKTLTDCAVCHKYFEGDRGARIQDAVEVTGDRKCTACHDLIHSDIDAVHTTVSTSVGGMECTKCHDDSDAAGAKVTPLHAGAVLGACAVCHDNPGRVPDITAETADCSSCHTASGADFHAGLSQSHASLTSGCAGTNCHDITDLGDLHSAATTTVAGVTYNGCDVCHRSPTSQPSSADCNACHAGHGDLAAMHTATASSQACADCHETYDVQAIHAASAKGACAVCHDNATQVPALPATVECANCHAEYVPVDPGHYDETTHTASAETVCSTCHYMTMKTEHSKAGVSPAVTCVSCHETKVDAFTGAWDKTCAACHASKHSGTHTKHVSTNTACGGATCHEISDVSAIHIGRPDGGCPTCHDRDTVPTGKTDCSLSGCHYGATGDHEASHDASAVIDVGCRGCHFTMLTTEHSKLGYTCDTCHSSANAAVSAAITNHQRACSACHPAVNGKDRHASQNETEFAPATSSAHRVDAGLAGMRSTFVVKGATYTWTLPSASSFLRTGWTTASVVTCKDCHNFGTDPAGPHGSAVTVRIDPAYTTRFSDAVLRSSSPGMPTTLLCNKCHTLTNGSSWSNVVHSEHRDRGMTEGGRCVSCHVKIPHGWFRPRLLGSTLDPAPYATVPGGMIEMALKSYTPSGWNKSDCYAGCSSDRHPNQSNPWPGAPDPVGTLTGKVTDSSGVAISGATVSIAGAGSTTTAADGSYTITQVLAGTYDVTASAAGYVAQAKPATVAKNVTTALDFTLQRNVGTLTGTLTDSATGAKLSGVTVSVAGDGSTTTDSNGVYTLTNVPAGSASVTYSKTGYTSQTKALTIAAGSSTTQNVALVPVPTSTYENKARAKTATASSYRSGYEPWDAFDGSTSTRWYSSGDGTQWLRVDLGTSYAVDKVVVYWYSDYHAQEYRVQYSNDGSSWSSAYSTSSGSSGTKTHTFSARSARYWRLYCTRANRSYGYSASELQVWGK